MTLGRKIAAAGGIFILLSGLLNIVLGAQIGALHYYPYLGGKMGHVGITAGIAAVLIGLGILFYLPRLYISDSRKLRILGSVLTMVLGHLGAIFGALYLGTLGVFLCYLAGIWLLINFIQDPVNNNEPGQGS